MKIQVSADLGVHVLDYVDVAVTYINSLIEHSVKEMLEMELLQARLGTVVSSAEPCDPTKDQAMFKIAVPLCYILNTTMTTISADNAISQAVHYQIVTHLRRKVSSLKYNSNNSNNNNTVKASHSVAWQSPMIVACPLGWALSGAQHEMPQEVLLEFQQASWKFLLNTVRPALSVVHVKVTSQDIVTRDGLTVYGMVLGECEDVDVFDNAVIQSYQETPRVFLDQWKTASSIGSNNSSSTLLYVSHVVALTAFLHRNPVLLPPVPWKQPVLLHKPVEYKERHWIDTSHVAMALGVLAVTIVGMGVGLVILRTKRQPRPVVPVLPVLTS